jgi:hypothetical protein
MVRTTLQKGQMAPIPERNHAIAWEGFNLAENLPKAIEKRYAALLRNFPALKHPKEYKEVGIACFKDFCIT